MDIIWFPYVSGLESVESLEILLLRKMVTSVIAVYIFVLTWVALFTGGSPIMIQVLLRVSSLLKGSFFFPLFLYFRNFLGSHSLSLCKVPRDNLCCNRRYINKVEMNWSELNVQKFHKWTCVDFYSMLKQTEQGGYRKQALI